MRRGESKVAPVHEEFLPPAPAATEDEPGARPRRATAPGRGTFMLVASGGVACAAIGALLGGVGGEFSVTPAPTQALRTANAATPGAPVETSQPETIGPLSPERSTAGGERVSGPAGSSRQRDRRAASGASSPPLPRPSTGRAMTVGASGGGTTGPSSPGQPAVVTGVTGLGNVLAHVVSMLTGGLVPATGLPVVGPVAVTPLRTAVTGVGSAISSAGAAPLAFPGLPAPVVTPKGSVAGPSVPGSGSVAASPPTSLTSPAPPVTATPTTGPAAPVGDTAGTTPASCLALPGLPLLGLTTTTLPLCVGS